MPPPNTTQHNTPHTRSSSNSRYYLLCSKRNFRVSLFSIFTNLTIFPCFAYPFFDSPSTHGSSRVVNMVCLYILLTCSLHLDFLLCCFPLPYLLTCPPTQLPIYLFIYLSTYLPTYLPTYLRIHPLPCPLLTGRKGRNKILFKAWNGKYKTKFKFCSVYFFRQFCFFSFYYIS